MPVAATGQTSAAASLAAAHPQRVSSLVIAAPYGLDAPLANAREMGRDELYDALTNDPSIFEGLVPDGEDAEFDQARALEGSQNYAGAEQVYRDATPKYQMLRLFPFALSFR